MYDYKIVSEMQDGQKRVTTYQSLVARLDLTNEQYMGAPLSEGGTPQCQFVMDMVKQAMPQIQKITAYFEGEPILAI